MRVIGGWLGSVLLALCGLPLLWRTVADGHARGVSLGFLLMWLAGEVLTFFCVVLRQRPRSRPLVLNYSFNLACVSIVLAYRVLA